MKLTEKETAAIAALQELAKTWPKTLQMGANDDNGHCNVWKQKGPGEHLAVADIKIRNIDAI